MEKKSTLPPAANASPGIRILQGWRPLVILMAAGFLLYGQSITFDYSYLDDTKLILDRMEWLQDPASIPRAFQEDVFQTPGGGVYYRPLLTVSFITDAVAGDGNLKMFRLSSILYHILAVWLAFLCLSLLGVNRLYSFLLSLVLLAHPAVTQAVAWIPGRNDILLAVFILASFYWFLRFLDTGKPGPFALHALFWFGGLLTKETAVVLPVLLLPAAWILRKGSARRILPLLSIWVILFFAWFFIRSSVISQQSIPAGNSLASLWQNLPALLPFLGKSVFPVGLSVFPVLTDMTLNAWLGVVALGVLIAIAVLHRPVPLAWIAFSVGWFVLFLVPSFIKHTSTPDLTEHRLYLPLFGLLLFFARTGPLAGKISKPTLVRSILLTVTGIFALLSLLHLQVFRDRYTFWESAVAGSPSHAYNYNTLGAMYLLDGDLDKAEPNFRKSLELNPAERQVNTNLGLILMQRGDLDGAADLFRKELRINPDYDNLHFNRGLLFYRQGKADSSVISFERTLQINPKYVNAYRALAELYRTLNRPGDYTRILEMAKQNGINPEAR